MKRREFLSRAAAGLLVLSPALRRVRVPTSAPWLLVPMDDAQSDHLKAYGLAFRLLERGGRAEWFLNYRSGSFLLPADDVVTRDRRPGLPVAIDSPHAKAVVRDLEDSRRCD